MSLGPFGISWFFQACTACALSLARSTLPVGLYSSQIAGCTVFARIALRNRKCNRMYVVFSYKLTLVIGNDVIANIRNNLAPGKRCNSCASCWIIYAAHITNLNSCMKYVHWVQVWYYKLIWPITLYIARTNLNDEASQYKSTTRLAYIWKGRSIAFNDIWAKTHDDGSSSNSILRKHTMVVQVQVQYRENVRCEFNNAGRSFTRCLQLLSKSLVVFLNGCQLNFSDTMQGLFSTESSFQSRHLNVHMQSA